MGLKFTNEMRKHLNIILMHEIISLMSGSGITQSGAIKEICSSDTLAQCIKDAQEPLPKNLDYDIRWMTRSGEILDEYLKDRMDDTKVVAKALNNLHLWKVEPSEKEYHADQLLPIIHKIVQNYIQPQGKDTLFLMYQVLSHLRVDVIPQTLVADLNRIEHNAITQGVLLIGGCLYRVVKGGAELSLPNLKAIAEYFEVMIETKRRVYLRTVPDHLRSQLIFHDELLIDLMCIVNGRLTYSVLVDGEVTYLALMTWRELLHLVKTNAE